VGCGHGIHVIGFATGSTTTMKLGPIPGCDALFFITSATAAGVITLPVDFIKRRISILAKRF
jgi:hypothetical protein